MKTTGFSIFLVLFVLAPCSFNYAQGVCPIINLKVDRIKGKILTNDKFQKLVKQTKVELISFGETDSVVASTITDDSGYFEINKVKKGKYALEAWFTVNGRPYFKYRLALTVKKSNDEKNDSLILVKLGGDCFTSEAKISK